MTRRGGSGLAVLTPLLGIALIALFHKLPNLRETASLATAGTLFAIVAGVVAPAVWQGARPRLEWIEVFAGLPLAFEVEPLGMLFATGRVGSLDRDDALLDRLHAGHHEKNQTRFYACFAIAISAAVGVAFSANLLTLFVFYEMLTLSTYPLVTHHRHEEARRAGRVYLGDPAGHLDRLPAPGARLDLPYRPAPLDFRPGGILAGRCHELSRRGPAGCSSPSEPARPRSCRSTAGSPRPWSPPPRSAPCCTPWRW